MSDRRWWVCLCGRKAYDHSMRTVPNTGGREYVCTLTRSGRFEPETGQDYGCDTGLRDKPAAVVTSSARCRLCGDPLIWAHSRAGRRVPLDASPTPAGAYVLLAGGIAHYVAGNPPAGQPLYISHFDTCPRYVGAEEETAHA